MKTKTKKTSTIELGQMVKMKRNDLMGASTGKIVAVEKVYEEVNGNGLSILESHLNLSKQFTYQLKGDNLFLSYPEIKDYREAKTFEYRFAHFAYTVDSGKMLTIFPARLLTPIK